MSGRRIARSIQVEERLARAPDAFRPDPRDQSSFGLLSLYLREYRSRPDYADVVTIGQGSDFVASLEGLRNALYSGDLVLASELAGELHPTDDLERAELDLEIARLELFRGNYEGALGVSEKLLKNQALSDVSRITILQIRGHCWLEKKDYERALRDLERATTLAEFYPMLSSGFAAWAFRVRAHAERGERESAQEILRLLGQKVEAIEDPELALYRLLALIRSEVQFSRHFEAPASQRNCVLEARALATFIGDTITLSKCDAELTTLPNPGSSPGPVFDFATWMFVERRSLVLWKSPKRIFRLHEKPVLGKVLSNLSRGPLPMDELFSKVWPARFNPIKHATHLRVTLSNVRRILPSGTLRVEDGIVSLT